MYGAGGIGKSEAASNTVFAKLKIFVNKNKGIVQKFLENLLVTFSMIAFFMWAYFN